jgi:hypothetical protein
VPVNATMDSEDCFYATLFAAYGVALLLCVKDIEQKSRFVYFLLDVLHRRIGAGRVATPA